MNILNVTHRAFQALMEDLQMLRESFVSLGQIRFLHQSRGKWVTYQSQLFDMVSRCIKNDEKWLGYLKTVILMAGYIHFSALRTRKHSMNIFIPHIQQEQNIYGLDIKVNKSS